MDGMVDVNLPFVPHIDGSHDTSKGIFDYSEAGKPRGEFAKSLYAEHEKKVISGEAKTVKTAVSTRRNLYIVNPFLLYVDPKLNSRNLKSVRNQQHIVGLAHSIAEQGVLTPLSVQNTEGRFLVVDGHCRYLAVMHAINVLGAEIRGVPILLEENKMQGEADRLAQQFLRNSGIQLDQMEAASCVARMRGHGWTDAQISKKANISSAQVRRLMDLFHGVTPAVQEMIEKAEVTPSTVLGVIKTTGSADRTQEIITEAREVMAEEGASRIMPKHVRAVEARHTEVPGGDEEDAVSAGNEDEGGGETQVAAAGSVKAAVKAAAGQQATASKDRNKSATASPPPSAASAEGVCDPAAALAEIKGILLQALTTSGGDDVTLILDKVVYDRMMALAG